MKVDTLLANVALQARRVAAEPGKTAVHDLRVAIRRLVVAMRICACPESAEAVKKLRKKLRRARLAAGEVRDRDIVLALLSEAGLAKNATLVRRIARQSRQAKAALQIAVRPLAHEDFAAKWQARISLLGTQPDWDAAAAIGAYLDAGRQLASGAHTPPAFHQFRILGKRLRYALELLLPYYSPGVSRFIAALRGAQDHLGIINDVATARCMLGGAGSEGAVGKLLAEVSQQAETRFWQLWNEHIDAPGAQQRYVRGVSRKGRSLSSARRIPKA